VPDWRRDEEYSFTARLTNQGWAWEFLRRDSRYVYEWGRAQTLNATSAQDIERIAAKFSLVTMYDPHSTEASDVEFLDTRPEKVSDQLDDLRPDSVASGRRVRRGVLMLGKSYVRPYAFARFDLSESLESQIRWVKAELHKRQREHRKRGVLGVRIQKLHKRNWRLYLRTLDGHTLGVKPAALGEALWPDMVNEYPEYRRTNRARETLEAAQHMVSGYREILTGK
jgi:hypothetical protein